MDSMEVECMRHTDTVRGLRATPRKFRQVRRVIHVLVAWNQEGLILAPHR